MKPELIIFDCDGTLTDSEKLNNQAVADVFAAIGYPQFDYDYCLNNFVGLTMSAIRDTVENKLVIKLPDNFVQRFIDLVHVRMKDGLQPVPQACESVEALAKDYKICVASNGERNNVIQSIKAVKLYEYFGDDKIFSKSQVKQGKPAPDLFLYAAQQMGYSPANCLVIEDSIAGVQAGIKAGMQVIGLTAVAHDPIEVQKNMKKEGCNAIFSNWPEIVTYISTL